MADSDIVPSSAPDTPMDQLIYTSTTVLQQAVDLVNNVLTADDQLSFPSRILPGSAIGKHLRHARDHFHLLLQCMSKPGPHLLNYDIRSRNQPMESSLAAANEALQATIKQVRQLRNSQLGLDEPITLEAVTPYPQTLQTTFGRELWFAGLHAIHHWSMIRLIAAAEMGIELDPSFGVAPSTLQHQGKEPVAKARI